MSRDLFMKTEFQREWVEKLRKYEEEFKSQARESDEKSTFPKKSIQTLVDIGYTKLILPREYGGEGIGIADLVLFQETISSFDGAAGLSIGWHLGVVGDIYEKKLWKEPMLAAFAEKILKGALVNRAASEAGTGSPTRGGRPETRAVKKGDKWIVTGRKIFTTMAPVLTHFLVTAWVDELEGIGTFLIERESKGVSIQNNWDMAAMRGTESHDLVLDHVEVGEEQFVEFEPLHARGERLNGWLLHIPACYLGIAQAARDYAVRFATRYSPNSIRGTIGELPNVQALIGQMELELMKARHVLYSVAEAYDDGRRRPLLTNEIAAAKHIVTNAAIDIVDKAMRIVGAKSLQLSNPLQRYYRDVRAGLHNPPMDDMTISKLAQAALKEMRA